MFGAGPGRWEGRQHKRLGRKNAPPDGGAVRRVVQKNQATIRFTGLTIMSGGRGCQSNVAGLFLISIAVAGARYFPRRSNNGKTRPARPGTEMPSFAERFL